MLLSHVVEVENILCETEIKKLPKTNSSVGISLGIKDTAILSGGE